MTVSLAKRKEFAASVQRRAKAAVKAGDGSTKQAADLVKGALNQIAASLKRVDPGSFTEANLRMIQSRVVEVAASMNVDLGKALQKQLRASAQAGADVVSASFEQLVPQVSIASWAKLDATLVNVAAGYRADLIQTVGGAMINRVSSIIDEALIAQTDPWQAMVAIVDQIRNQGELFSETLFYAERIWRTESLRVLNLAQDIRAQQVAALAPGTKKQWNATKDDRTRKSHEEADGQVVAFDDWFKVGSVWLPYPVAADGRGSSKDVASETINCRCWVSYILPPITVEDVAARAEQLGIAA